MNINLLYTFLLIVFTSCHKNEALFFPIDESKLVVSSPIIDGMFKRSFKEDFIVSNPNNAPASHKSEFFVISQAAALKNPQLLAEKYIEIKPLLIEASLNADVNDYYILQEVALRYLRNHFLIKEEVDQEEIYFLLEILLKHKAIDLDVLVDGYLAIKSNITSEKQEEIENYVKSVLTNTQSTLKSDFYEAKSRYENSTDSKEATGAALTGKMIERKYLSCEYTKELMNW